MFLRSSFRKKSILMLPFLLLGFINAAAALPGDLDPTFRIVETSFPVPGIYPNSLDDLVLLPDGNMLGVFPGTPGARNSFDVGRFLPNGAVDSTWSFGWAETPMSNPTTIATQTLDGNLRYVVGGQTTFYSNGAIDANFHIMRFNSATRDTFGDSSFATSMISGSPYPGADIDFNHRIDFLMKVLVQADQKIIGVGTSCVDTNPMATTTNERVSQCRIAAVRLLPNGQIDNSFGMSGKVFLDWTWANSTFVYDAVLQPDGKILVSGVEGDYDDVNKDYFVVRLDSNGALDRSFGASGTGFLMSNFGPLRTYPDHCVYDVSAPTRDYFGFLALQPDSSDENGFKIVLAGGVYADLDPENTNSNFAVMRLNSNGRADESFGCRGKTTVDFPDHSYDLVRSVVIDPRGKIILIGSSDKDIALARLLPSGIKDNSFGQRGMVLTRVGGTANPRTGFLQDGKLLVSGGIVKDINGMPQTRCTQVNSRSNNCHGFMARYKLNYETGDYINILPNIVDFTQVPEALINQLESGSQESDSKDKGSLEDIYKFKLPFVNEKIWNQKVAVPLPDNNKKLEVEEPKDTAKEFNDEKLGNEKMGSEFKK